MIPEDNRLTSIDNVFLLRKTKRLPAGMRNDYEEVKKKHSEHPIDIEVIKMFVNELQIFINSILYKPNAALERGSFSP